MAATVTSKRAAMALSVSPALTVYVLVPEGSGAWLPPLGLGAKDPTGAGLGDGDGLGVRLGAGLVDGMGDWVVAEVGRWVGAELAALDDGLDSTGGEPVSATEPTDADGEPAVPPGVDSPIRATAIAAKAITRRTMSTA